MDLGRKSKPPEAIPAGPGGNEDKISYPQFDIRDEAAKAFSKEYDCDVGDEITATVKLRVSGQREDEYGSSKTFEVMDIDNVQVTGEEEGAEEPDEEEKILGYKRPQSTAPVPDVSAAEEKE